MRDRSAVAVRRLVLVIGMAVAMAGVASGAALAADAGGMSISGRTGANGWMTSSTVTGTVPYSYRGFASTPHYDGDYDEIPTEVTCYPGGPGSFDSGGHTTFETGIPSSGFYTHYFTLRGEGVHQPSCTGYFDRRDWDCSIWGCSVSAWYRWTSLTRGREVRIDSVRPYDVAGVPDRAPVTDNWHNAPTTVRFRGSDATSGIASCTQDSLATTSSRATRAVQGSCTDRAGNQEFATYLYRYDDVPPTVAYGAHPSSYDIDEHVGIACEAQDAASGIASTTCEDVDADASSFGVGSHVLRATATDVATNVGEGSTTFTVVASPIGLFRLSRRQTGDLREAAARKDDGKRLAKALEALDDALMPSAWTNADHLPAKDGKDVFKGAKSAIDELDHVLGDKARQVPAAPLRAIIDQLTEACRLIASTAIGDAVAADGSVKKLDDAREALAKGDDKRDAGKSKEAVDRYRDAWQKASDALGGA